MNPIGKCFWNMGSSEPIPLKNLKIWKPHMSMSQKIMALNIVYTLGNKKRQIPKKTMYYLTTILTLFTFSNLSSYIFQNTTYFLTGLFCINFFFIYLSIYLMPIFLNTCEISNFSKFWKCREHWCPCAPNPLLNPMIQLLWYFILQGAHDERVRILWLAKHDLRVFDRWVPHLMGPACSEGKLGPACIGSHTARYGHQWHSCGMSGHLRQSMHRARSGHQRKAWARSGHLWPLIQMHFSI
jgi:hypothetical protein